MLLAGDAVHQFPATGVAINAGVLDAANLAWKLGLAVAGGAPEGLLDTYDTERRQANERTLLHTRALGRGHGPGDREGGQGSRECPHTVAVIERSSGTIVGFTEFVVPGDEPTRTTHEYQLDLAIQQPSS
ncbi:FAD-dependent monooxygenase [Nocardioides sp. CER19]|uniref:FAD-dependent monooxygenase n=1 Tax=Nocardioides sp. CER19 TaxID=3038538 RepID=UPI00244C982A|nr:FAD-dependent monooxygenase [Nocardioides sp. CER19]MDH2413883.1 FAD-dependent monooxygenase [Nocardioides sp. CER19]